MGLGAGCQCCALLLFFSALDAAPGHQKQEDALCTAVMRPLQLTSAKQVLEHCCCLYSVVFRAVSVDVGKVVRKDPPSLCQSYPEDNKHAVLGILVGPSSLNPIRPLLAFIFDLLRNPKPETLNPEP